MTSSRLRHAAQARGFGFSPRLVGPGLPGALFQGERITALDVVDAREASAPFLAGTVTGTYAADSSLPRALAASFVAIPLPRTVPHLLLFGRGIGMLRLAGIGVPRSGRLGLEGDFDRHFTLYCPEGYERDALRILTPDLMAKLLDTTHGCDVEFVDDWMFVYSRPAKYRTEAALDGLVAVTSAVRANLDRQAGRYSDERSPATMASTVSPEEHAARVGRVSAHGSRVRTRATPLQRIVTIASTVALIAAGVYVVIDLFLR